MITLIKFRELKTRHMEKIKITMKNIYEETIYKKKIYTIYPKKHEKKTTHRETWGEISFTYHLINLTRCRFLDSRTE